MNVDHPDNRKRSREVHPRKDEVPVDEELSEEILEEKRSEKKPFWKIRRRKRQHRAGGTWKEHFSNAESLPESPSSLICTKYSPGDKKRLLRRTYGAKKADEKRRENGSLSAAARTPPPSTTSAGDSADSGKSEDSCPFNFEGHNESSPNYVRYRRCSPINILDRHTAASPGARTLSSVFPSEKFGPSTTGLSPPQLLKMRQTGIFHVIPRTSSRMLFTRKTTHEMYEGAPSACESIHSLILRRGSLDLWQCLFLRRLSQDKARKQQNSHQNSAQWIPSPVWRPFALRSISFSKLQTPLSDALLALDASGSYMVTLGTGGATAALSLKFYGVPSPSLLRKQKKTKLFHQGPLNVFSSASSLMLVIPLLSEKTTLRDNGNDIHQMPVQMLISRYGMIGVAYLRYSCSSNTNSATFFQDDDSLGTIVIFPLPQMTNPSGGIPPHESIITTYKCDNVPIGGCHAHTMLNLLWPTRTIPDRTNPCRSYIRVPSGYAHIVFNDENDGYRMAWITTTQGSAHNKIEHFASMDASFPINPRNCDIITTEEQGSGWEAVQSNPTTGSIDKGQDSNLSPFLAFEAYLHVDALLYDILHRRQQIFVPSTNQPSRNDSVVRMPDFFFNLIALQDDGRAVVLALVFANPKLSQTARPKQTRHSIPLHHDSTNAVPCCGSFCVIIELNIFNQSYREIEWVRHPTKSDPTFLRCWVNTLATNWRMKEIGAGPYCVTEETHPGTALEANGKTKQLGTKQKNRKSKVQHRAAAAAAAAAAAVQKEEDDKKGQLFHSNRSLPKVHEECYNVTGVLRDEYDDFDPLLWSMPTSSSAYTTTKRNGRRHREEVGGAVPQEAMACPSSIAMSSLYPCCDLVTNFAVVSSFQPVKKLGCRCAPLELIYE